MQKRKLPPLTDLVQGACTLAIFSFCFLFFVLTLGRALSSDPVATPAITHASRPPSTHATPSPLHAPDPQAPENRADRELFVEAW